MAHTKADVARILVALNEQAGRLGMSCAGSLAVETMGGTYLYLTDRSRMVNGRNGPGARVLDLAKGWHGAYERLFTLAEDWRIIEIDSMNREG